MIYAFMSIGFICMVFVMLNMRIRRLEKQIITMQKQISKLHNYYLNQYLTESFAQEHDYAGKEKSDDIQ